MWLLDLLNMQVKRFLNEMALISVTPPSRKIFKTFQQFSF